MNWYGGKYWNEDLSQWAGMWVYIEISDWLAIELDVFPNGRPNNSHDERLKAQTKEKAATTPKEEAS